MLQHDIICMCYGIDMPSSSISGKKKVGTGAKMPGVKRRGVELVPLSEDMVRGEGRRTIYPIRAVEAVI